MVARGGGAIIWSQFTMGVTLSDVAAMAGVSRSAVSRTFNKGGSVSPEMRAKVEAAAQALGYRPNPLAASLKTGRTGLVALVCDDFSSAMTLAMQARLTRRLEAGDRQAVLLNFAEEMEADEVARRLTDHHVDAAILVSSALDPSVEKVIRRSVPATIACLPRHGGGEAGMDEVQTGRLAGRKLVGRGYQSIGYVGGPEGTVAARRQLAGLQGAVNATGASILTQFVPEISVDAGRAATERLLARARPDVLFCGDDLLALGALAALDDLGLSVPEDIGVLGVGDIAMAAWPQFALSTLRPPKDAIAEMAVAMVVAAINRETMPAPGRLPCRLVNRKTLRPLPPSD